MDKPPRPSRKEVFLNYKIWLSSLTGHGQIENDTYQLLEIIDSKGTLRAAAEDAGMSYRKAWGKITSAEDILGYPLLEKHRGGKNGGNSTLTPASHKLLEAYRALQQRFDDSIEEAFNDFVKNLNKQSE
ncbi:MAG: ModE family transcriptional regulator [Bacteroidetes bacterium HGW-Bacteroidetes-1]|jgi:molybdate transport repressor ModE-like protein|nr:MAG: ModE family transcriptional regulator [Bacteroidetes bacterium HGW-Bacteroidetes-1]